MAVLFFEDLQLEPERFLADFLAFVGVTPVAGSIDHTPVNERYSPLVTRGLRLVNAALGSKFVTALAHGEGNRTRTRRLARRGLKKIDAWVPRPGSDRGFEMDEACRKMIQKHFGDSNRRLFEMLGERSRYEYP